MRQYHIFLLTSLTLFCVLNITNVSIAGDTWTKRDLAVEPIWASAAAAVGDKIYVIGGRTPDNICQKTTREYHPETDSWEIRADMPTPRFRLSACAVNGKVYVMGGTQDNWGPSVLSAMEEYDPATNTWTKKADMPTPRHSLNACVVDNKIYAIGGLNGSVPHGDAVFVDSLEVYDPETDKWEEMPKMPELRKLKGSGVVDGKIYIIGSDINKKPILLKYDPVTDQLEKKSDPLTLGVQGGTAGVLNGKIYSIGGALNLLTYSASVEEYDPLTDTWRECADMPTARCDISSGVMNGKIYVFGGWNGGFLRNVEEYTPPDGKSPKIPQQAVNPQDKLISTWSAIKNSQ